MKLLTVLFGRKTLSDDLHEEVNTITAEQIERVSKVLRKEIDSSIKADLALLKEVHEFEELGGSAKKGKELDSSHARTQALIAADYFFHLVGGVKGFYQIDDAGEEVGIYELIEYLELTDCAVEIAYNTLKRMVSEGGL